MISKRLYVNFPVFILILEWFAVLYFHFSNPYHFVLMSKPTLNLILLGLLGLLSGYYTMHSFYLNKQELPELDKKIHINQKAMGIFLLLFCVVVFLGILLCLREIAKVTNNLNLYFTNPFMAREQILRLQEGESHMISLMSYKIGSYLSSLMYPMAILGGVMTSQKSRWRLTGLLPLVLVILNSLINLNRFGLIVSLGLWFFSLIYFSYFIAKEDRTKLLKRTAIYVVLAVLFILFFFYLILSLRGFYIADLSYYVKRSFYAYFSGSPSALEKLLYEPQRLMYGASSFRSIAKWFGRLGLIDPSLYLGAHNSFKNISMGLPMTINTFTFVKTPYEDFGSIGVVVMTIIWGALARFSIEKCFAKFSLFKLFVVSIFVISFFMSFYEFFFQGITMFIFWSVILVVINEYFINKRIIVYES